MITNFDVVVRRGMEYARRQYGKEYTFCLLVYEDGTYISKVIHRDLQGTTKEDQIRKRTWQ